MAATDLFLSWKDGEEIVNPATGAYVGGQPLMYTPTGLTLLANAVPGTTDVAFAGISRNDRADDLEIGRATYYGSNCKLKVWDNGTGCPFDVAAVYVVGKVLKADAAGKLTSPGDAAGRVIGIITKVPSSATDTLEFVSK